jgi:hypothetical protein
VSNRAFLASLAGPLGNPLHDWLADHWGEPRLAWYPSAGTDFRDVLYLHPDFRRHRPGAPDEPAAPDLYLHTDYCVAGADDFLDHPLIHQDSRCRITVRQIAELPRLNVPFHEELVAFGPSPVTGRVIFLVLEVESRHLARFRVPVVYAFVENAAFCAGCLLPGGARISHVVQVRYGHGLGGGRAGPEWVRRQLPRLGTEVFVTDGSDGHDFLNEEVCAHLPGLSAPPVDLKPWPVLRELPYKSWQGYGPVRWLRVPRGG